VHVDSGLVIRLNYSTSHWPSKTHYTLHIEYCQVLALQIHRVKLKTDSRFKASNGLLSYNNIWYIRYDIWYTIWYMIWYVIRYDDTIYVMIYRIYMIYMIWYNMIWYNMIWYMVWYGMIYNRIYDMVWYI